MIETLVLTLSTSITLSNLELGDSQWPTIREVSKSIVVTDPDNPAQAGLEITIDSIGGTPLYDLKCHSGDYESVNINYSGLMQCYLFSRYSVDRIENLLSGDSSQQTRAWQNRARFLAIHLIPACADYPEWGAIRHFKLRNMELTLAVTNIIFQPTPNDQRPPPVRSYRFNAIAMPVPGAISEIAQRVESPEPAWFYSTGCNTPELPELELR